MAYASISPIAFESVSQVTSTNSVELGTYRREGATLYVYAYNAGNNPAWPGDAVYLSAQDVAFTGSFTSGYSFDLTNAVSQVGVFAGAVQHSTFSTAQYGWLAVQGLCRIRPDTSNVSQEAGTWLQCGVNNGFVSAPVTISTGHRIGICINSIITNAGASAASSGKGWIKSDVW